MSDLAGSDDALAARLATDAGRLLLVVRTEQAHADQASRKAVGDAAAHEFLTARLAEARPHDAVFSEEGIDDLARLDASRVWIVDPLDGTREFSEFRDDWAVHVALWQDGELVAGAVALPASDLTFATPDVPLAAASAGRLRLVVSRTRPPAWTTAVRQALGADVVPMGSAGAKVMAVVRGVADVYLHAGGQYEWDSAAPVAVARAAGLHASRLDGSPLRYNCRNPLLPDLVICRPELTDRVHQVVTACVLE